MVQRHLREEGRRPETRDQRPQPAMVRPLPGPPDCAAFQEGAQRGICRSRLVGEG